MTEIAVVGSINQDLTIRVPRHPRPGETVLGREHFTGPGGKGANQAVAAARLGRRVAMVGRVGGDDAGAMMRRHLEGEGVDITHVGVESAAGTGVAVITLDDHAENAIVVSPGANGRVSPTDVAAAVPTLAKAAVILLQLEIPVEAVVAAARAAGGTVVLNPAPAQTLPDGLLASVDVLVPNRSELAVLGGWEQATDVDEAAAQAEALGVARVVVTLGADGALVLEGEPVHIPAVPVDAVDTTGAGDAFCGALADGLVRGLSLVGAARWAAAAAAVAVTRSGAQSALPTASEVAALMGGNR